MIEKKPLDEKSYEQIDAVIVPGKQLASGGNPTFKQYGGTIQMQKEGFKERGLDLDAYFKGSYFSGTLNLSVAPHNVHILNPRFKMKEVRWTKIYDKPGKPFAENFFLDPVGIIFKGSMYKGLFYIPDPATKPGGISPPMMIEVIAQKIPGIIYGSRVSLVYNSSAVSFEPSKPGPMLMQGSTRAPV